MDLYGREYHEGAGMMHGDHKHRLWGQTSWDQATAVPLCPVALPKALTGLTLYPHLQNEGNWTT